jgi:shikimate kinase
MPDNVPYTRRRRNAPPPRGNAIVLIGLMGTGKTTVGRIISQQIGALHLDTDGETDTVRRIRRRPPNRRLVLSTGGGLPLRPENAKMLRQIGTVIWLRADPTTLVKRVERKIAMRPLLAKDDLTLHERMSKLCDERNQAYEKIADYIFDTQHDVHATVVAASILEKCSLPSPNDKNYGQ